MCCWLQRTQARGGRADAHRGLSLAHSYHWLGSFGNSGNGRYREELRRALAAIRGYLATHQLAPTCALLRLDGQYGTGAVIVDLAGFSFVMRGLFSWLVLDSSLPLPFSLSIPVGLSPLASGVSCSPPLSFTPLSDELFYHLVAQFVGIA